MIRVGKRVCGVRVHHQLDRRKMRAHRLDSAEIPAMFDFDLDAAVPGLELTPDLLHQLIERVLNADRNARRNAIARLPTGAPGAKVGATERFTERLALLP